MVHANGTALVTEAVPYLPVYNAHPCIVHTPILDCTLGKKKKKKEAENRRSGYAKLVLKNHDFDTLKKRQLDHLFRKIVSLDALGIHETISSSDGFFWW